jgi:hypothetical protein
LGKGETFCKLTENNCDFNEYVERVINFDFGYDFPLFHRDEIFLGKCVFRNFNKINLVKLKRNILDVNYIPGRINREDFYSFDYNLLYDKNFVDCHIPNDWKNHMDDFEKILKTILTYN